MTAINAIKIGKTLGPLLEVENGETQVLFVVTILELKLR
jgi:hypothetical protein